MKRLLSTGPEKIFVMVNEGLSDRPKDTLPYSVKQELEQVAKTGERIAACMAKWVQQPFYSVTAALEESCCLEFTMEERILNIIALIVHS